jgi:hypothetical protein
VVFPTHYRAVIEGGFFDASGNQVETWSTSYRVGVSSIGTTDSIDVDDYIDNELTTFATSLFQTLRFNSQVKVTKLSCNRIGPDGRYADPSASHFKELTGTARIEGQGSSQLLPIQTSLVVTLRSDKARGPASHGRMYLPVPQAFVGGDWLLQQTFVDSVITDIANAFRAADGTGSAVTGAYSFFPALVSPAGTGHLEKVTKVGVGRVLDTMRSRRRSIPERHQMATL